MKVAYTGTRFEIYPNDPGLEKSLIKKGWILDKRKWCVYTRLTEIAKRSGAAQFDAPTKQLISRHDMAIAFSGATEAFGLDYPVPEGLEYLGFQKAGIAYQLQHPDCLLADEPGLGKTIQLIGLMNADTTIKKTLIICPAMLKLNWWREIENWSVRDLTIGIGDSSYLPDTDVAIINYDILGKLRPIIEQRQYDLIGADECHMVNNPTSKRGRAFWGKYNYKFRRLEIPALQARRRVCITGTPLINHPVDLWEYCRNFDPERLGAVWTQFAYRYCAAWDAPWGFDYTGSSNLEELQAGLRSTFMVRRKKADVLKELPPKRRQIVTIPADEVKVAVARERELFERNIIKINKALDKAEWEQPLGTEEDYKKVGRNLINFQMAEDEDGEEFDLFSNLGRLRHEVALAKLPFATTYIKLMLEEHDKIVVFAHHLDLLNGLYKEFERDGAILLTGEVDMGQRDRLVEEFQKNPKRRVCICGITLAVGITLTAADYALLLELDWRPAVVTQSEDRLHRIGQKESVLIQHLVFEGSTDSIVVKRVIKKQEDADKAVG
jgi:SWI/SNF-related matrix-associated actin-dependent regulator 1 of chromatin subfamily A